MNRSGRYRSNNTRDYCQWATFRSIRIVFWETALQECSTGQYIHRVIDVYIQLMANSHANTLFDMFSF